MYSKESAPLTGGYQAQAYPTQPGYAAYPPQAGYAPQQQQQQQYAYEGKPVDQAMPAMGVPTQDQLQTRTPCNDLWAALLFLGHVLGVIGVAIACGREWSTVSTTEGSWSSSGETGSGVNFDGHLTRKSMLVGLGVGGGFSIVAVVLFLILMRLIPKFFVWLANLVVIGLYAAVAVYYKTWVMLIPVAFMILWLFLVRKRIPLAALLLGTASRLVFKYWGGFVVSVIALIIKAVYFIAWGFAVIYLFYRHDIGKLSDGGLYGATAAFVFMGFWTIYVVQGIVRVTISGAIASWYFFGETNGPSMPTASSFKRATTTSFGSICFGAAVVAVLSLLRAICRSMRGRNNAFVQCLCECFLGLLERMMQYFNAYAFTHIAIYGASYIEAAKLTWRFMANFVFSAIINDSLYSSVIALITLGNMIWIPVVAAHITHNGWSVLIAVLVTFAVHIVTIFTVPMAITALFVCIAENGEVLAINHPQLKADLDVAIAILNENPCMC